MLITLEQQALAQYEVIPSYGGYPITVEPRREPLNAVVFHPDTASFRALHADDVYEVLTPTWGTVGLIVQRVACRAAEVRPLLDQLVKDGRAEPHTSKVGARGRVRVYYRRRSG